jgi:hypothetical protein
MKKVILELPEMPDNCENCLVSMYDLSELYCPVIRNANRHSGIMADLGDCTEDGRRDDCPLKEVEIDGKA